MVCEQGNVSENIRLNNLIHSHPRDISMLDTPEEFLSKLNQMRKDLDDDPDDPEWVVLHQAFCFISYKFGEFGEYWREVKEEEGSS
jgi:hypothetical protein